MGHSSRVKQFAYAIDPACWISYSGKPPEVKRALDARRNAALKYATENLWRVPWNAKFQSPFWRDIVTDTKPEPWTAFKMKIMLHMAATPQFPFMATVAPIVNEARRENRDKHFRRICKQLEADGLILLVSEREGLYTATPKGKVFVDAVLSTPLPVPAEPEWKMPSMVDHL